jgi:hypothetical protein
LIDSFTCSSSSFSIIAAATFLTKRSTWSGDVGSNSRSSSARSVLAARIQWRINDPSIMTRSASS